VLQALQRLCRVERTRGNLREQALELFAVHATSATGRAAERYPAKIDSASAMVST
jgi:hypothetical protein